MTYTWQKILHFTSSRSEWHALGKGLFIFTTLALHWNGNVCHICFNGRFRRVVLIHCSGHAPHAFGRHERVEMYARYASVFQFPGLRCTPFHAYFTGGDIVAAGCQFPGQRLGQVYVEHFGQHRQLVGRGDRFQARHDGTVMPSARQRSTKAKYFALSKNICVTIYDAPASTLAFRWRRSVSRLGASFVFLGIAGHPVGEWR